MTKRGAVVHPMSGAGDIKDDGHDDVYLYEVKNCGKSFRLVGKDMRGTFVRAVRQGRLACWLVNFPDYGFTAEIKLVPTGNGLELMTDE